ncbi:hypothetical protein I547_1937 [Mycobacterium kansasii 824]|uniref:Uncharacterized protein n=1 Tax=Mycobacterium kansasii TaxID=1768 RepID=A0A1V3WSG6_MYCKA|nr:hypothetical protein I547_1937 [Mycobacterium kansasii 824]OOK69688.1 hypothetical protein BZL29_6327 [Mycobacterium kansasii]
MAALSPPEAFSSPRAAGRSCLPLSSSCPSVNPSHPLAQ